MKCNKIILCGILLLNACFSFKLHSTHFDLEKGVTIKNNALRLTTDPPKNLCNNLIHIYLDTYNSIMNGSKSKCNKYDKSCNDIKSLEDFFKVVESGKSEDNKKIKGCIQSQDNWK